MGEKFKFTPITDDWDGKLIGHRGPIDCSSFIHDEHNPCLKKRGSDYVVRADADAEWVSEAGKQNNLLTFQFRPVGYADVAVMEAPELGLDILPTWNGITCLHDLFGFKEARRLNSSMKLKGNLIVEFHCFFSFGDFVAFAGREMAEKVQRQMSQKRRMKVNKGFANPGSYYVEIIPGSNEWYKVLFDIVDISAQMGIGGLKQYAAKVNLPLGDKGLMDEYKSNMLIPYTDPELIDKFVDYAAGDCVNELIRSKFVDQIKSEFYSTGDDDDKPPSPNHIPLSTGATVEQWFRATVKSDYLTQRKDENGDPLDETEALKGNPSEALAPIDDPDQVLYKPESILGQGSAKAFMEMVETNTTIPYNLLVQGGRCKNEFPCLAKSSGTIGDADIAGCYGNGLMNQTYPIGLPTLFGVSHRAKWQKAPTLGQFRKKWKHKLLPGLWSLVVDTDENLDFDQTLIFSKPVDNAKFYRKLREKVDEDDPEVDVNFCLLTRQIQNGIITHDILQVLKAVCNQREWKAFMNLRVKTGAAYLKSNRCNSMAEVEQAAKNSKGIEMYTLKKGGHTIIDRRSRAWFGVELSSIVGPLLEKRSELKALKKQHRGSPLGDEYDAKQNLYKLFVNTLYGVLASPYFLSGNTVVANNITARARALAWMMSAAAGGIQSITDGSAYDINAVRDWDKKRPGIEACSTYNRPHLRQDRELHRYMKTVSLGGKKWSFNKINDDGSVVLDFGNEKIIGSAEKWQFVDDLYLMHLQHFFRGTDIDILFANGGKGQFGFEHKDIYSKIVTQSQSNYRLTSFDGKHKVKARGHSLGKQHFNLDGEPISIPAITQLFEEIDTGTVTPKPQTFTHQPLKINAANEISEVIERNCLLAGDSVWKKSRINPISLSLFMWPDLATKHSWETMNEKYKRALGWGLEAHFYDESTGVIDYERALRDIQKAIDNGRDWYVGTGAKMHSKSKFWDAVPQNPLKEVIEREENPEIECVRYKYTHENASIMVSIPESVPEDIKIKLPIARLKAEFEKLYMDRSIDSIPSDRRIEKIVLKRRKKYEKQKILKT
ncbi:MAG: hypothetical protein AAGF93_01710 [Cyanobacteria bacterium P01_H01_bin.105]